MHKIEKKKLRSKTNVKKKTSPPLAAKKKKTCPDLNFLPPPWYQMVRPLTTITFNNKFLTTIIFLIVNLVFRFYFVSFIDR